MWSAERCISRRDIIRTIIQAPADKSSFLDGAPEAENPAAFFQSDAPGAATTDATTDVAASAGGEAATGDGGPWEGVSNAEKIIIKSLKAAAPQQVKDPDTRRNENRGLVDKEVKRNFLWVLGDEARGDRLPDGRLIRHTNSLRSLVRQWTTHAQYRMAAVQYVLAWYSLKKADGTLQCVADISTHFEDGDSIVIAGPGTSIGGKACYVRCDLGKNPDPENRSKDCGVEATDDAAVFDQPQYAGWIDQKTSLGKTVRESWLGFVLLTYDEGEVFGLDADRADAARFDLFDVRVQEEDMKITRCLYAFEVAESHKRQSHTRWEGRAARMADSGFIADGVKKLAEEVGIRRISWGGWGGDTPIFGHENTCQVIVKFQALPTRGPTHTQHCVTCFWNSWIHSSTVDSDSPPRASARECG